jgi:SAM-dependent methyltransferase
MDVGQTFDYYDRNRSNFQAIYGNLLRAEAALAGRVIDIGCGHGDNPSYPFFSDRLGQLDGVDPFPMIEPVSKLTNRWTCGVEELPVPDETYDLAYSYNVVEHIAVVDDFLRKVVAIIKPGSCYWSMSPNYYHPFTILTRMIQRSGLLSLYRKRVNSNANDYPAYYVMSNEKNIVESIKRQNLPIARIDFYYIPNVNWDSYFPKRLRFIGHLIDNLFLLRNYRRSFIFMFRIEKAA